MAFAYVPYDGPIVTRADAKAFGLKRFFTGRPCRNGHIYERFVSTGQCYACLHSWIYTDKGQDYHKSYRVDNSAKIVARVSEWRVDNPEKFAAQRDRDREPNRVRMFETYWEDPETARANHRAYYAANPDVYRPSLTARRARKQNAEGSFTREDIQRIRRDQRGRCAYCKKKLGDVYHIDHIIPLVAGGTNWPRNLQITCSHCNLSKSSKDPIIFAQKNGLLL